MPAFVACPLVAGGQAFEGFRTYQDAGSGPLVVCSLLLVALLLCFPAIPAKYALFRILRAFLARFVVVVWVCVVLVVCVACVALYACGVRRIKGLLRVLPLFYIFCPALVLLSCFRGLLPLASCLACSAAFLALWVGFFAWLGCWLSFPSDGFRHKKKGRNSLRPLLSCCELV